MSETIKTPDRNIICDICKKPFILTKDCLVEKELALKTVNSGLINCKVTMLTCPHCGKQYPVIVDDAESAAIVEDLRIVLQKIYSAKSKKHNVPSRLINKQHTLRNKLSFKRQQLAKKLEGSFYQTEDGKEQLDYHYHV